MEKKLITKKKYIEVHSESSFLHIACALCKMLISFIFLFNVFKKIIS
jgi:hypothetical protein